MREYGWRLVWRRDTLAVILAACVIGFMVYGSNEAPDPHRGPCLDSDWHFVASFFVVVSLAVALLEFVNWAGWLITRDRTLPSESETPGALLFIPGGWGGPVLALGLLVVAYALRRPNLCESFHIATMSLRDFTGVLSLSYGLLIMAQGMHGLNLKG